MIKAVYTFILIVIVSGFGPFSASAQNVNGYLRANGTQITNDAGGEFIIRGMGPGGWMLQEGYMFGTPVGTQHEIRAMLEDLTDKYTTDSFYDTWLENFFTRHDVELVAEWGFNSIRVPLHYNLFTLPIEEEPVLGENTWLDKGFNMVDDLLTWCEDNDIYLILDLHGAPGGQGKNADISDYDPSKPSLWESEHNRSKTVAIWQKLATRYADKVYIGGYDLLNETNWGFEGDGNSDNGCDCNSNTPLLELYTQIIDVIRAVDNNHIIFIEGNCWANNYNGLLSLATYDSNMAFSFHKYWNSNTDATIQGLLDMRAQTNVPLYLGETGENSNTWLTDMVKQMERLGIGWSTWAYKQMDIDDPFTILSDKWQVITDYNPSTGANRPSEAFAKAAMADMLDKIRTENCQFNPGVVHALTGSPFNEAQKAIKTHDLPGMIYATDYDMGKLNEAWYDVDYQTLHVSTGEYTAWNQGYLYRNDGVDIETCTDVVSNGYNIAWTNDGEWLKYTINSAEEGYYDITFRVAAYSSKLNMRVGNQIISSQHIGTPSTGGYQTWKDVVVENVFIPAGTSEITLFIVEGGLNINYLKFELDQTTALDEVATKNGTDIIEYVTSTTSGLTLSLNNQTSEPIRVDAIDLLDVKGSVIDRLAAPFRLENSREITFSRPLAKGLYIVRLLSNNRVETRKVMV